MQGNILGQSAGINIHGIIEEYKVAVGEKVSSGDFVEFVNKFYEEKELTPDHQTGLYGAEAVRLSDNKIFVAYDYGSGNNKILHAMVVTIEDSIINTGIDTIISTETDSGSLFSAVALDEERIYIAYYNSRLSGVSRSVLLINSDNGIEIKSSYFLSASVSYISTTLIDDNKVFLAYCQKSSGSIYGTIDVVDDENKINSNSYTQLVVGESSSESTPISSVLLSDNRIFIVYSYGSNEYLYGICCTFENTSITIGDNIKIGEAYTAHGKAISAIKLNENTIFIASIFGTGFTLGGIVCKVEEMNVEVGIFTQLTTIRESANTVQTLKISHNKVFIIHQGNYYENVTSSSCVLGMICIINDKAIIVDKDSLLGESYAGVAGSHCAISLSENAIFLIFSKIYLFGAIYKHSEIKSLKNRYNNILGIAKTSGNSGQVIKVIAPNYYDESEEI